MECSVSWPVCALLHNRGIPEILKTTDLLLAIADGDADAQAQDVTDL